MLVCRRSGRSINAAHNTAAVLRGELGDLNSVSALVVDEAGSYEPKAIAQELNVPLLGMLASDRIAAAVLSDGALSGLLGFRRSKLFKSAHRAAAQLAPSRPAWLSGGEPMTSNGYTPSPERRAVVAVQQPCQRHRSPERPRPGYRAQDTVVSLARPAPRHGRLRRRAAAARPSLDPIDGRGQRQVRGAGLGGAAHAQTHRRTRGTPVLGVSPAPASAWQRRGMEDEDALIEAVLASLGGLGRLEPLLTRGDVEDIFFNGPAPVWLRLADGSKVQADPIAKSNEELRNLLQQLGTTLGDGSSREFSDARPLLALRLKGVGGGLGARLSAATDVTPNPVGTIRIHRHAEADLDEAYRLRMIDNPMREFLRASVKAGLKIAIVGAMGHGKTFLLRCCCAELPLDTHIVTVEDERELGLHVLPARNSDGDIMRYPDGTVIPRRPEALVKAYESRPANAEGYGAVTVNDLLHHALRDSADVLILGESRSGEIVHFLDAATNGTSGVMGTWHANSADEVFERIVQMVLKAQPPLPTEWALRAATALDLVVFVSRNDQRNGRSERLVSELLEVESGQLGERGLPVTHHLFEPRPDGRAMATGRKPTPANAAKLRAAGFDVDGWLRVSTEDGRSVHSDWDRPDEGDAR